MTFTKICFVGFVAAGVFNAGVAFVSGLHSDRPYLGIHSILAGAWFFWAAKEHSRMKKDRWRG